MYFQFLNHLIPNVQEEYATCNGFSTQGNMIFRCLSLLYKFISEFHPRNGSTGLQTLASNQKKIMPTFGKACHLLLQQMHKRAPSSKYKRRQCQLSCANSTLFISKWLPWSHMKSQLPSHLLSQRKDNRCLFYTASSLFFQKRLSRFVPSCGVWKPPALTE